MSASINMVGASSDSSPLSELLEGENNLRVGRAVADLPSRQRLIVFLLYYEDRTQAEIAEIMQLSPTRVSQLHAAALKQMRKALA